MPRSPAKATTAATILELTHSENVTAAQEWRQEVHHHRATGRTIPDLPDRITELIGKGKAECAQASSAGHCGPQFRAREAAHSGLTDRHVQA
jgi:hypothetical protein